MPNESTTQRNRLSFMTQWINMIGGNNTTPRACSPSQTTSWTISSHPSQIQPQVFRGSSPITNPAYILTTSSHSLQSLPTDSGQTTADHMSMPAIPGGTFLIHVAQEPRRPGIADAFEWDLWGRSLSNSTPTLAQRGKIPMLPRGAITV
jgi:hypothetical protein